LEGLKIHLRGSYVILTHGQICEVVLDETTGDVLEIGRSAYGSPSPLQPMCDLV